MNLKNIVQSAAPAVLAANLIACGGPSLKPVAPAPEVATNNDPWTQFSGGPDGTTFARPGVEVNRPSNVSAENARIAGVITRLSSKAGELARETLIDALKKPGQCSVTSGSIESQLSAAKPGAPVVLKIEEKCDPSGTTTSEFTCKDSMEAWAIDRKNSAGEPVFAGCPRGYRIKTTFQPFVAKETEAGPEEGK